MLQVDTDIVLAGLFGLWISMNYDVMGRVYRIQRRAAAWMRCATCRTISRTATC